MARKLNRHPRPDLDGKDAATVFREMMAFPDWTIKEVTDGLPDGASADEETVKAWLAGSTIPQNRDHLRSFLFENSQDEAVAEAWWQLIENAWARKRLEQKRKASEAQSRRRRNERLSASAAKAETLEATPGSRAGPADVSQILPEVQRCVLEDRLLNTLPSLFETNLALPLERSYVELRVADARPFDAAPHLLEATETLAEKIEKRVLQRLAIRRPVKDALDVEGLNRRLILGSPGSGKSSLLRRITLDIAAGKWETAKTPVFVEARSYATAHAGARGGVSLLEYGCSRFSLAKRKGNEIADLLLDPDHQNEFRPLLLIDGLDEIATDRDAAAAVYDELNTSSLPWIATARPAGLIDRLAENRRFEMVELDEEAIGKLIGGWCACHTEAGTAMEAERLRAEIDRVPSVNEMARNPFLLSALCFLKSTSPADDLPRSRIGVYEALLDQIALQAQRRHRDRAVLSAQARYDLSQFCCHLYSGQGGVRHIFRDADWHEFVRLSKGAVATSLEDQITPARLLAVWHETDPQYHFLHLTLQEHLVAQAMIDWPVERALHYRFAPAWQTVFRFYGALLLQRGRTSAFAELTAALYQSRDVSGLSLITLAQVFADAGISDTTDKLGVDLREEIWEALDPEHPVGMEALIDALALLDPDWLTQRALENEQELVATIQGAALHQSVAPHYDGQSLVLFGGDFLSPFLRLARARTPAARQRIADVFRGDDLNLSLLAAHAFAETATPAQCRDVVRSVRRTNRLTAAGKRAYAFALAKRNRDFLPFLDRLTAHLIESGEDPFSEAISLIADIGGPDAAAILEERLCNVLEPEQDPSNSFDICARAVCRLGGAHAHRILEGAARLTRDPFRRQKLKIKKISIMPGASEDMVAALRDRDTTELALSALADAVTLGQQPAGAVVAELKRIADDQALSDIFDLAIIERHRVDAGEPENLCAQLLAAATEISHHLHEPELNDDAFDLVLVRLTVLFDAFSAARWRPAKCLAIDILNCEATPPQLAENAVTMLGHILEGTNDRAVLELLEEMLFSPAREVSPFELALAIGRISLDRLFGLRGAQEAPAALQHIAAERGLHIFNDFWVDRTGRKSCWKTPPKPVRYWACDDSEGAVQFMSHYLSADGNWLTDDWPIDCCVALIEFKPPLDCENPGFDATTLEIAEAECIPVFEVPEDVDDETLWPLAVNIREALRRRPVPR